MSLNFKSETIGKFKDLSDNIKANLIVEDTSIKEKEPHSAYYAGLPEGINKKSVDELSKYNSRFMTAAHVAVGELAAGMFKGNKAVSVVEAELGFFGKNDSINITVQRSKTYQNHLAKDGDSKEVTKNLVMSTTASVHSAKGTSLKSVKEAMSEEFSGMFKK